MQFYSKQQNVLKGHSVVTRISVDAGAGGEVILSESAFIKGALVSISFHCSWPRKQHLKLVTVSIYHRLIIPKVFRKKTTVEKQF